MQHLECDQTSPLYVDHGPKHTGMHELFGTGPVRSAWIDEQGKFIYDGDSSEGEPADQTEEGIQSPISATIFDCLQYEPVNSITDNKLDEFIIVEYAPSSVHDIVQESFEDEAGSCDSADTPVASYENAPDSSSELV